MNILERLFGKTLTWSTSTDPEPVIDFLGLYTQTKENVVYLKNVIKTTETVIESLPKRGRENIEKVKNREDYLKWLNKKYAEELVNLSHYKKLINEKYTNQIFE
jgi:DNA repair ATPase RecN